MRTTASLLLPKGREDQRSGAVENGMIRYNTDSGSVEYFNGTIFQSLGTAGAVSYTVDSFNGDGSTTVFTMSVAESTTTQIIVFVGSIYQDPVTAYTLDGGFDITFTSAPGIDIPISVIHSAT